MIIIISSRPSGFRAAPRAADAYVMFSSVVETEAGEKAAKEEAVVENTTPDYAAGLVSAQVLVVTSLKHS